MLPKINTQDFFPPDLRGPRFVMQTGFFCATPAAATEKGGGVKRGKSTIGLAATKFVLGFGEIGLVFGENFLGPRRGRDRGAKWVW